MKAKITFYVKDEEEFLALKECSKLPGEEWNLFDDFGFILIKDLESNEVKKQ